MFYFLGSLYWHWETKSKIRLTQLSQNVQTRGLWSSAEGVYHDTEKMSKSATVSYLKSIKKIYHKLSKMDLFTYIDFCSDFSTIYALWNSNCYAYATWVMPHPHHTGQIRKYAPYTKITPSEMSYELSEYTHQHYKWLSAIVFCPILFFSLIRIIWGIRSMI